MRVGGPAPTRYADHVLGGLFEGWHPIVLIAIALIVFGPGKLPEVFGQVGRGVREFREQASGTDTSTSPVRDEQT